MNPSTAKNSTERLAKPCSKKNREVS